MVDAMARRHRHKCSSQLLFRCNIGSKVKLQANNFGVSLGNLKFNLWAEIYKYMLYLGLQQRLNFNFDIKKTKCTTMGKELVFLCAFKSI